MHEMSLMYEIILLVSKDAKLRGYQNVTQIQVIIGDLSNVVPDALESAFLYFCKEKAGLVNEQSQLTMIREKAITQCQNCLFTFEPDNRIALCPKCHSLEGHIIAGETFQVEFYEGSDLIEN